MDILVTGATGYIGGRLVPRLLAEGHRVHVLVRDPRRLAGLPWQDQVQVVQGDLLGELELPSVDHAYYLVHAMAQGEGFASRDVMAAKRFLVACDAPHIIYLGGICPEGHPSPHLQSRAETGQVLATRATTEIRAGPVLGSGSASFEMLRYLTERLPVMVTPRWVDHDVQPIAIRDLLAYLVAALDAKPGIYDVGMPALSFRAMMQGYAKARGLHRTIIASPFLAPRLASHWVGLITPIPSALAAPLLEGIVQPVIADTTRAQQAFPHITPMPYEDAIRHALERVVADDVETNWAGAQNREATYELQSQQNLMTEVSTAWSPDAPSKVFARIKALGGKGGWPAFDVAWKWRGRMDRLVGGPGLRRGRRSQKHLRVGDAVDFWRVEALDTDRLLLRSEMRMPGKAWLEYRVEAEDGGTRILQTALYEPRGLGGVTYWWAMYPVHRMLFPAMVKALARGDPTPRSSQSGA